MNLFFKYFFKTLRFILEPFMLLWDKLTTPKGIVRSEEEQNKMDEKTRHLALYQFRSCPFCIKVRRQIKRQSLNIDLLDAQNDPQHRNDLLAGGGEIKVPCLRIENEPGDYTWMYESDSIIKYLQKNFA
jgi:glutaredoxin